MEIVPLSTLPVRTTGFPSKHAATDGPIVTKAVALQANQAMVLTPADVGCQPDKLVGSVNRLVKKAQAQAGDRQWRTRTLEQTADKKGATKVALYWEPKPAEKPAA